MLFKTESNWKKRLGPEDEQMLNEMIEKTTAHRPAYTVAEEVKAAQLWCALLEIKKENLRLRERLGKLEYLLDGFVSRAVSMNAKKQDVIESHERF